MKFEQALLPFPKLHTSMTDRGRVYHTVNGKVYPSVTTVLSKRPEKIKGLQEWRNRVGEEEANRVSGLALRRGTTIDKLIEDYILGQETLPGMLISHEIVFNQMKKCIDENLEKLYGVKTQLYSNELKIAGEADFIGSWKGVTSIIDNKTSNKEKRKEYIEDYFLQTTIYSLMFEEMTSHKCPQVVIVIGCEDIPEAQCFVEPRSSFENKAKKIISDYYRDLQSTQSMIL